MKKLFTVIAVFVSTIAIAQIEVNTIEEKDIFKDFHSVNWSFGPAFSSKNESTLQLKYKDISYLYSAQWGYLQIPLKDIDDVIKTIEQSQITEEITEIKLDNGFSLFVNWQDRNFKKEKALTLIINKDGISQPTISAIPFSKFKKLFYGK